MYIFVCLKSQRCRNHSLIRQNSSVFVSLNCFQLITQASRQKTYEQAVQIYLCQWVHIILFTEKPLEPLKIPLHRKQSGSLPLNSVGLSLVQRLLLPSPPRVTGMPRLGALWVFFRIVLLFISEWQVYSAYHQTNFLKYSFLEELLLKISNNWKTGELSLTDVSTLLYINVRKDPARSRIISFTKLFILDRGPVKIISY